jgi:ankyrin repeat protein
MFPSAELIKKRNFEKFGTETRPKRKTYKEIVGHSRPRNAVQPLSRQVTAAAKVRNRRGSVQLFPMYVLPVKAVLGLTRLQSHEELVGERRMVHWTPDKKTMFVSHGGWVAPNNPDPTGALLVQLKTFINGILGGHSPDIAPNWAVRQTANSKSTIKAQTLQADLLDGYVWLDYWSLPQNQTDHISRELAISSIPTYVNDSVYFAVLANDDLVHEDGAQSEASGCSEQAWCRLEQLVNFLSPVPKPLLVIRGAMAETQPASGRSHSRCWCTPVGEGKFIHDGDRGPACKLVTKLLGMRKRNALDNWETLGSTKACGELHFFRMLHVLTRSLLHGLGGSSPRAESLLGNWLAVMKFKSVNEIDEAGMRPIHYLALDGNLKVLEAVLDEEHLTADVDAKVGAGRKLNGDRLASNVVPTIPRGATALHIACQARDQPELVRLLLARGANPRAKDCDGLTPLMYTSLGGGAGSAYVDPQAIRRAPPGPSMSVISAPPSTAGRRLSDAGQWPDIDGSNGYIQNCDVLLQHNAALMDDRSNAGVSPLASICMHGSVGLLEHVLQQTRCHAEFSTVDQLGSSMLMNAAMHRCDPKVIQMLVEAGCDVNLSGKPHGGGARRAVAVFLARYLRRPSPLQMHVGYAGGSALNVAAYYGHTHVVDMLLANGAAPAATGHNPNGATPLHLAAIAGNIEICTKLIAAGASSQAKDKKGLTAAQWAQRRGHADLAAMLGLGGVVRSPRNQVVPSPVSKAQEGPATTGAIVGATKADGGEAEEKRAANPVAAVTAKASLSRASPEPDDEKCVFDAILAAENDEDVADADAKVGQGVPEVSPERRLSEARYADVDLDLWGGRSAASITGVGAHRQN